MHLWGASIGAPLPRLLWPGREEPHTTRAASHRLSHDPPGTAFIFPLVISFLFLSFYMPSNSKKNQQLNIFQNNFFL
jgi:hypothetical protein